jgi:hypothetical protein
MVVLAAGDASGGTLVTDDERDGFGEPWRIDLGKPVAMTSMCVCGSQLGHKFDPKEMVDQLEATGRMTVRFACQRCENVVTLYLEGKVLGPC